MKIKLLDCFSGPDIDWQIGDVIDVSKAQGERFIKLGHAELVKDDDSTMEPDKVPQLKIYDGKNKKGMKKSKKRSSKKPKVKKSTMSNRKGRQKIQTTSIS